MKLGFACILTKLLLLSILFLSLSIGLGHDGDNNCSNGVNIMSTAVPGGAGALKWSSCSRDVLQGFLRFVDAMRKTLLIENASF